MGGGIFGPLAGVLEERGMETRREQEWSRESQVQDLYQQLQQVRINAGLQGADQASLAQQADEIQAKIDALGKSGPRGKRRKSQPMDEQLPAGVQLPGTAPGVQLGGINITPGMTVDQVIGALQRRQQPGPMSETPPQGTGVPGVPPWAMPKPAVPAGTTPAGAAPIATTDPAAARRIARLKATAVYPETTWQAGREPIEIAPGQWVQRNFDPRSGTYKDVPVTGPVDPFDQAIASISKGWERLHGHPPKTDEEKEEVWRAAAAETGYRQPQAKTPRKAWTKDSEGRIYSYLTDAMTGATIAGSENYNEIPPSYMLPHIRYGTAIYTDASGRTFQIPTTGGSSVEIQAGGVQAGQPEGERPTLKTRPGGGRPTPPAGTVTPTTPGAGPPATTTTSTPTLPIKGARYVGYKGSQGFKDLQKDRDKAFSDEQTVQGRYQLMTTVADRARSGDIPAQNAIIANYLKSTTTGQGLRVTQTEWNNATLMPWLESLGAHFTDQGIFGFSKTTNPLSAADVDRLIRTTYDAYQEAAGKRANYDQALQAKQVSDTGQAARGSTSGQWSRSGYKKAYQAKYGREPSQDEVKKAEETKRKAGARIVD